MRSLVKLISVCFVIVFTLSAAAQAQNSKSNNSGNTSIPPGSTQTNPATPLPGLPPPPTEPPMQMPLVVPLFLEGNQFTSTLTLVNNSTATTYADVTIRGLDGTTIASKRVDFTPHSQRRVNILRVLDEKRSPAKSGSILVMQSPDLKGPSIAAVLSMTYLGSGQPNYIDEEIFMPSMNGSQVLQGVADSGDGSPILAISSLTESLQHVLIQCLGKDGAGATRRIALAAGETLITEACAGNDTHDSDLTTMLEEGDDATHGPQGIRLVSDAMSGSFAAFAFARHKEDGDRFFSSVLFTDPKMTNSPNTVFTGVPVGTSASLLPEGRYVPELTLTNFSNKELHVHTTFARSSGDNPITQEVGSLSVPAHSTRELILRSLQGDPALQNSFVVHSDGEPGDLMTKFVSKGNSRLREVELQAKDEADMENAGAHPWSIEGNTDSTLLLFNHSTTLQTFTVTVSSAGFEWQKEYKLVSMQTKAIDIRELVDEQVKDDTGKALPKSAQRGEANWLVTKFEQASGRLLQSDRSAGIARNFSCGYSGLLCGAQTTFYSTFIPVGTIAEFADVIGITCTGGAPNACTGQQTGTANFSTNWVSLSPSVASISGGSNSSVVNLLGVSGGTSQVNGHLTSAYCQSEGGGTATVTPTLSLSNALFYNAGLALPSTFTEASASTVVTALGVSGGTFAWSLSSPSGNIASFSSSSVVTSTSTASNTVTVYAAGASKSLHDLTITLKWTPSGGSPIPATFVTQVDSPYSASFVSQTPLTGAQTCTPFVAGNNGWYTTYTWQMLSFFGNPLFGMNLNETFTNIVVSQQPGYGYTANGANGVSGKSTFTDAYCAAFNPDGAITTKPPQNPLLTDVVDSATQTYRLGSTTLGSGTIVQTQTLTRYRDHITVTNIAR